MNLGNKKGQRALRRLFSRADYFGCDKSGRINMNEKFIVYADLVKEAVLVGNLIAFNIWHPECYDLYLQSDDDGSDDFSELFD